MSAGGSASGEVEPLLKTARKVQQKLLKECLAPTCYEELLGSGLVVFQMKGMPRACVKIWHQWVGVAAVVGIRAALVFVDSGLGQCRKMVRAYCPSLFI